MLRITNIDKYFNKNKSNEIHVIDNTSLDFNDSGLVVLLGHSGSGKTTLLNVIGGLDKAKGSIQYDDVVIEKYKMTKMDAFRSKHIGYIFQNYNLLLENTVYENLEIALNLCGIYDKDEIDKRIRYCLTAVNMYKFKKRKAQALSGGQQQRIAIARALIKNPDIIIADEPTGNLDSKNTVEIMNIIKKISKTRLVLLVTHEEKIAKFYADRIISISDGKICDDEENHNDEGLDVSDHQNIYLKDLNKEEYNDINIYFDKENKVKLDIILKDGNIYINSYDANIKVINQNCDAKIIDDHYRDIKLDDIDDFSFDTSDFDDKKGKRRLFSGFKEAFFGFFNVTKRKKLLYFCFFMLGMIIAGLMISYSDYSTIDANLYTSIDESIYFVEAEYIEDVNMISNIQRKSAAFLEIPSSDISFDRNFNFYLSDEVIHKVIYGRENKKGEILISRACADQIIKNYSDIGIKGYEDVMKFKLCANYYYSISGIIDSDVIDTILLTSSDFFMISFYDFKYSVGFSNREQYDVVNEVDLNENTFLLNIKYMDYIYDEYFTIGDKTYEFGGFFKGDVDVIIEEKENLFDSSLGCVKARAVNENLEKDEALVSICSKYTIGDEIKIDDKTFIVKDLFYNPDYYDNIIINDEVYNELYHQRYNTTINNETKKGVYVSIDEASLDKLSGYNYYNLNEIYLEEYLLYNQMERNSKLYSMIILAFIICVFTFFINRSKMIHQIYTIGVKRSIGASRLNIYGMFIFEILIVTTFTSILGYSTVYILAMIFNNIMKSVMITISINFFYAIVGVLFIYLVNILFGLMPAILLMRKTPSEILAKYDI